MPLAAIPKVPFTSLKGVPSGLVGLLTSLSFLPDGGVHSLTDNVFDISCCVLALAFALASALISFALAMASALTAFAFLPFLSFLRARSFLSLGPLVLILPLSPWGSSSVWGAASFSVWALGLSRPWLVLAFPSLSAVAVTAIFFWPVRFGDWWRRSRFWGRCLFTWPCHWGIRPCWRRSRFPCHGAQAPLPMRSAQGVKARKSKRGVAAIFCCKTFGPNYGRYVKCETLWQKHATTIDNRHVALTLQTSPSKVRKKWGSWIPIPICSMVLVYLPTWLGHLWGKCWCAYSSTMEHGFPSEGTICRSISIAPLWSPAFR